MRVERGASQILFGMLPAQTVDIQGRVWQVSYWADPVELPLDQTSVRQAFLDTLSPWTIAGTDDGLADELRGRREIAVVGVNPDRGVVVDPFPKQWRCRSCGRLRFDDDAPCVCGSRSLAQMQFVAYHTCGKLREPPLPKCPTHRAVGVRLPGTTNARELLFFCPVCNRTLSRGFPFQMCECKGGQLKVNVHRSGDVFSPHFTVLVNPPDPAAAASLRARGGGARALEWVLDGMPAESVSEGMQTVEGFVEMLVRQGLTDATARALAQTALASGEIRRSAERDEIALPPVTRERAEEEALSLSSAIAGGRVRTDELVRGAMTPPLQALYRDRYPQALREARLRSVDLLTDFPVASLAIGFTRGEDTPGESTFVPFRERGAIRAYGSLMRTEALLVQLDPLAVHAYLLARGNGIELAATEREARTAILRAVIIPSASERTPQPLGEEVLTVLHSYAHRTIRALAVAAGVERDGLSEYLLPHHLGFVIYAASRGDFVLGGLQAVFETGLDRVLEEIVYGETRCPLDPGCRSGGGACMACLHLGEPSCRLFNRYLNRTTLFDELGYLRSGGDR